MRREFYLELGQLVAIRKRERIVPPCNSLYRCSRSKTQVDVLLRALIKVNLLVKEVYLSLHQLKCVNEIKILLHCREILVPIDLDWLMLDVVVKVIVEVHNTWSKSLQVPLSLLF